MVDLNFKLWLEQLTKEPDISQIESIYNKSHVALKLAEAWPEGKRLLSKVSVVSNLASGVYGIFMSKENKKILPPDIDSKIIHYGKVDKNQIQTLPNAYIKQMFPDIDVNRIQETDTIHVNVRRIITEIKDDLNRIIEIASTIIHEATHVEDFQGKTKEKLTMHSDPASEAHAQNNEKLFQAWVKSNMKTLILKIPELNVQ